MNILIKWPTRGRGNLFFQTLSQWRALESQRHKVVYLIAIDLDDPVMNNPASASTADAHARCALSHWPRIAK